MRTPRDKTPPLTMTERKRLRDIRERAKTCMKDLPFIIENMHNVVADPPKQFAIIFLDDTYARMMEKVIQARRAGLLFGQPTLLGPDQIAEIMMELGRANIQYIPERLYKDAKYRREMCDKLDEKENERIRALLGKSRDDKKLIQQIRNLKVECIDKGEVGKPATPGPARSDDRLERALGHLAPKEG